MTEVVILKHWPAYDHFGTYEISRDFGLKVADEWEGPSIVLSKITGTEGVELLNIAGSYRNGLDSDVSNIRSALTSFRRELSSVCCRFYAASECVCVIGM